MASSGNSPPGPEDRTLVLDARRGSAEAADLLLGRHWSRAWTSAYAVLGERAAAEDAAQAAAERAFLALDRFDETRPFGPWLARIAANQALNMLRARGREQSLGDGEKAAADADPYAEILVRDEVVRAVSGLSADRRMVVALRYWADLDPREIAEALGIPVGTVTSRLARALAELRAELEEEVESR